MQPETVGETVRLVRSRRRLEQIELARACGWRDASAVSRIETDRVHPTRRTLLKLAQSLARDPADEAEIRSWLLRAAGLLPTRVEVEALADGLAVIDPWPQPAAVLDFGWNLWRANASLQRFAGVTDGVRGRNLLHMLFDPDGHLRPQLGDDWDHLARRSIAGFRHDTDRHAAARWRRRILDGLNELPGFAERWANPPVVEMFHCLANSHPGARYAMAAFVLRADARLVAVQLLPEDVASARALLPLEAALV